MQRKLKDSSARVLVCYLGLNGAGPAFTYTLACELAETGHICGLALARDQELFATFSKEFRERVFPLDVKSTGTLSNVWRIVKLAIAFRRILISSQASHVLIPMHHPWTVLLLPLISKKAITWSVVHDAKPHDGDRRLLIRIANFIIAKFSARTLFLTDSQRAYQATLTPRHASRFALIRLPTFRHYGRIPSLKPAYDFVFFGRLEIYKGLGRLLESFRILRRSHSCATLLIVGKLGPGLRESDLLTEGVTVVAKYIADEEVPKTISLGRVVVLPYDEATQSGIMVLACAVGRPCVATPCEGLIEQAAYTGKAVFAESFHAHHFAAAMIKALSTTANPCANIDSGLRMIDA